MGIFRRHWLFVRLRGIVMKLLVHLRARLELFLGAVKEEGDEGGKEEGY